MLCPLDSDLCTFPIICILQQPAGLSEGWSHLSAKPVTIKDWAASPGAWGPGSAPGTLRCLEDHVGPEPTAVTFPPKQQLCFPHRPTSPQVWNQEPEVQEGRNGSHAAMWVYRQPKFCSKGKPLFGLGGETTVLASFLCQGDLCHSRFWGTSCTVVTGHAIRQGVLAASLQLHAWDCGAEVE